MGSNVDSSPLQIWFPSKSCSVFTSRSRQFSGNFEQILDSRPPPSGVKTPLGTPWPKSWICLWCWGDRGVVQSCEIVESRVSHTNWIECNHSQTTISLPPANIACLGSWNAYRYPSVETDLSVWPKIYFASRNRNFFFVSCNAHYSFLCEVTTIWFQSVVLFMVEAPPPNCAPHCEHGAHSLQLAHLLCVAQTRSVLSFFDFMLFQPA